MVTFNLYAPPLYMGYILTGLQNKTLFRPNFFIKPCKKILKSVFYGIAFGDSLEYEVGERSGYDTVVLVFVFSPGKWILMARKIKKFLVS